MTEPSKIKLELELDQINTILEALGALPFAKVYALIHDIQSQAQAQLGDREQVAQPADGSAPSE